MIWQLQLQPSAVQEQYHKAYMGPRMRAHMPSHSEPKAPDQAATKLQSFAPHRLAWIRQAEIGTALNCAQQAMEH